MCKRKSVEREISVKNAAETMKKSAGVMLSLAWLLFSRAQRPYLSKYSHLCYRYFSISCEIVRNFEEISILLLLQRISLATNTARRAHCTPFTCINRTRAPRKCLKISNSGDFR